MRDGARRAEHRWRRHAGHHERVDVDDAGIAALGVHQHGHAPPPADANQRRDLAERARTKKLKVDEVQGGTFTITNPGVFGSLFGTPIINQPQVAILGTGAVVKRPVVVTDDTGSDGIAVRSMVYLALTYDHRLVDGADAARFLSTMKARLEDGSFDAELGS